MPRYPPLEDSDDMANVAMIEMIAPEDIKMESEESLESSDDDMMDTDEDDENIFDLIPSPLNLSTIRRDLTELDSSEDETASASKPKALKNQSSTLPSESDTTDTSANQTVIYIPFKKNANRVSSEYDISEDEMDPMSNFNPTKMEKKSSKHDSIPRVVAPSGSQVQKSIPPALPFHEGPSTVSGSSLAPTTSRSAGIPASSVDLNRSVKMKQTEPAADRRVISTCRSHQLKKILKGKLINLGLPKYDSMEMLNPGLSVSKSLPPNLSAVVPVHSTDLNVSKSRTHYNTRPFKRTLLSIALPPEPEDSEKPGPSKMSRFVPNRTGPLSEYDFPLSGARDTEPFPFHTPKQQQKQNDDKGAEAEVTNTSKKKSDDVKVIRVRNDMKNFSLVPKQKQPHASNHLCPIVFKSDHSSRMYKVAEIVVEVKFATNDEKKKLGSNEEKTRLEESERKLATNFCRDDIMERFPGLVGFGIKMKPQRKESEAINQIQMVTETVLDDNEVQAIDIREKGVGRKKGKNPEPGVKSVKYKYIEVKCIAYNFESMEIPIPEELFGKDKSKLCEFFQFEFVKFDGIHKEFVINLNLNQDVVIGAPAYLGAVAPNSLLCIPILNYCINRNTDDETCSSFVTRSPSLQRDCVRFFALARDFHLHDVLPILPKRPELTRPENLQPKAGFQLLDYQKRAVSWMLKREGFFVDNSSDDYDVRTRILQETYLSIQLDIGLQTERVAFYCPTTGIVALDRQLIPNLPSGGILADEMGLGKTFETISLILWNPRPGFGVKQVVPEIDLTYLDLEVNSESEFHGLGPGPSDRPKKIQDYDAPSKSKPVKLNFQYPKFLCRCGTDDPNKNKRKGKIITCIECKSSHHAICFGYQTSFLTKEVERKYVCPCCVALKPLVPAKSTLIVVPASIIQQWVEEIEMNVFGDLKLLIYKGITRHNYQPAVVLSQYDVVLTTFEVLKMEKGFVNLENMKTDTGFRHPKRFAVLPSPLTLVGWWRVCLDEAQLAKDVDSVIARMAQRIPAVHRWCITGTPITNSLKDLYVMVNFLGVEPICDPIWWKSLIMEPFSRDNTEIIRQMLGRIFWRTEKKYVRQQLKLPRQTEITHRLEMGPIEKFYSTMKSCHWVDVLKRSLEKYSSSSEDDQIGPLNTEVLSAFTKLRQICCHPELGNDIVKVFKNDDANGRARALWTITSTELLSDCIQKAQTDCSVNYRPLVNTINALAGLHMLRTEWGEAAKKYRRVLNLAEKHRHCFDTQDLQLYHAMSNLIELMRRNEVGEYVDTDTDSVMSEKAKKIRKTLLQKQICSLNPISKQIEHFNEIVLTVSAKLGLDPRRKNRMDSKPTSEKSSFWWTKCLDAEGCLDKIAHLNPQKSNKTNSEDLTTATEKTLNDGRTVLLKTLHDSLLEMQNLRLDLLKVWRSIKDQKLAISHEAAKSCERLHTEETACTLCIFYKTLVRYESMIFGNDQSTPDKHELQFIQIGTEKIQPWRHTENGSNGKWCRKSYGEKSNTERILEAILNFVKQKSTQFPWKYGQIHMRLFRDLKSECCLLQDWFISKEAEISAFDYIHGASQPLLPRVVERIGLIDFQRNLFGYKKSSTFGSFNLLTPDVTKTRVKQGQRDLKVIESEYEESLSHLSYLEMLKKYDCGRGGFVKPDSCALCSNQIDHKWGILPCEHCICAECRNAEKEGSVCPQCRQPIKFSEVICVNNERHTATATVRNVPWPVTSPDILCDPFSKVEAVVRTLLFLKNDKNYQNDKVLVVSTWQPMLNVLELAFHQNGIQFMYYQPSKGNRTRKSLIAFRTNNEQVLLMPLTVASTGLNLTEASHIFLVEPILNKSHEQQAIGRIYRLGQRKETYVHRFYVAGTVEEKLHMKSSVQGTEMSGFDEGNLTVHDLKELLTNLSKSTI